MRAIYIHIPFCRSRCHYCTFTSGCNYMQADDYIQQLCSSVQYDEHAVDSVFVGGGTPSTLTIAQFDKLFDTLYSRHNIVAGAEITVECNPDSITVELMQCLVGHGVNRISIGLQSCNDNTLATIGRRHSYATFEEALQIVRKAGIDNINVDIMIALPETQESFEHTVSTVVQLDITHVSMYALELYPESRLYSMVSSGQCMAVADDDSQAQWYDMGMDILHQYGYDRYEVSNFAKNGKQCRHNLHYWHCDQYYGYGLSAHGYIDSIRYSNCSDMQQYLSGNMIDSSQYIDAEESMQEYIMLALRLDSGASLSIFEQKYGVDMLDQFPNIARLVGSGRLYIEDDRLCVNTSFTYVLTAILAEILYNIE